MQEKPNTKEEKRKEVKYTVKDSVFSDLFRDRKYLLQLYQALHPEDTEVKEEELTDITIHNVLMDHLYNDLGFSKGEKVIIMVEAQSGWTVNIIIRALLYLARTYHNYYVRTGQNLYGSKKVKVPRPELYVIYTGDRKHVPEEISLSEEFFQGEDTAIDVKVKVIHEDDTDSIISQYITKRSCGRILRVKGKMRHGRQRRKLRRRRHRKLLSGCSSIQKCRRRRLRNVQNCRWRRLKSCRQRFKDPYKDLNRTDRTVREGILQCMVPSRIFSEIGAGAVFLKSKKRRYIWSIVHCPMEGSRSESSGWVQR